MSLPARSRIAPTPSGFLHQGNAFSFLLTEELVRQQHGSLRLRIDDLDADRVRPAYLENIFESLNWLGIEWHEGPRDIQEAEEFSQIRFLPGYTGTLAELVRKGRVFACECSRRQLQQDSRDGQYPGTCRDKGIPLDRPGVSWRFRTGRSETVRWNDMILGAVEVDLFAENRDFVIRRRDGIPAYHIASLCSDVGHEINLIVRGGDLIGSTAAQLLLAQELNWQAFLSCHFFHHPLILDERGEKLSKSAGSQSLKAMRAEGILAADLRRMAADWYRQFLP